MVEGGSTLTQQLVKQVLLARGERASRTTLSGKLHEIVLALRVEHRLTKREVLALYLNLAPYGNQFQGIRRAAAGYFGAPLEHLTAAQAAFLAGLPRRPAALDAWRHRSAAIARQRFSPMSPRRARAYAFGRGGSLEFAFNVAAKTGTSQAYHDNWTIGSTREVTVGPAVVRSVANASPRATELRIVTPPAGALYLYDASLRREYQTLKLQAHAADGSMLVWTVDGETVARAAPDEPASWSLVRGRHRIEVRDDRGRMASTAIDVR